MGSPAGTTGSVSSCASSSATSSPYSSPAQSFSSTTPINGSTTVKWKARDAVARKMQESDEEEELDDDFDDFGCGSARQRSSKRETLIDILNSGPPEWMQNPSRESVTDASSPRAKKRNGLFARAKQSTGMSSSQISTSESIAATLSKSIRLSRSSGSLFRTGRVGSLGNATGSSRTTRAQKQAQAADDFARSLDPDTRKISLQMAESPGSESLMSFLRSTKADEASCSPGSSSHIGEPCRLPRTKPASIRSSDKFQDGHDSALSPTRVFFHDLKVALEGNPMMTTHRGQRSITGGHSSSGDWEAGMHEDASLASQWVSGEELTRVDSFGVAGQEVLASPPRSDPSTPRHLSYTSQELDKSPGARRSSIIARDSSSSMGGSSRSNSASEGSLTSSGPISQRSASTAKRITRKSVPTIEDTVPELAHKSLERKLEAKFRPEDDTGPIATGESPVKGRSESGPIAGSPSSPKSRHHPGSASQIIYSQPYNGSQSDTKLRGATQSTILESPTVVPYVFSASTPPPPGTPPDTRSTTKVKAIQDDIAKTNNKGKSRPESLVIPPSSSTGSACASDEEWPTSARSFLDSGSRRRAPRRTKPPPKTPLPSAPGESVKIDNIAPDQPPTNTVEDRGSDSIFVGPEALVIARSISSSPDSWTRTQEGRNSPPRPIDDSTAVSEVDVIALRVTVHPKILSALKDLRTSMSDTAKLDIPEAGTGLGVILPTLSGMRAQFKDAVNLLDSVLQLYGDEEVNEGDVVERLLGDST
ncbi:BQ2448_470 [Microbotryum intermedium]|uniref:BQ2448_470 protein n=1 Tax=Microbotryum intermedium TaxID=269621 RepID=A0A238F6F2_9BASI|nr:BQ2448_470 [Microbotryum intermedium]